MAAIPITSVEILLICTDFSTDFHLDESSHPRSLAFQFCEEAEMSGEPNLAKEGLSELDLSKLFKLFSLRWKNSIV